jgi:hypothetical protein
VLAGLTTLKENNMENVVKRKIDYLMFKVKGQIVKVDPDIYSKIINPQHEPPYKKYNGDIVAMQLNNEKYAVIKRGHKPPYRHIALSRFVMNAKEGQIVDHKNRDTFDNRRCNLRIVNGRQNMLNRRLQNNTGLIGVSLSKVKDKFFVHTNFRTREGKRLTFYCKDTPFNRILTAMARDKFVLQAGEEEYAPLNFPCWKFEPLRSILLNEDLRKYKETRNPTIKIQ